MIGICAFAAFASAAAIPPAPMHGGSDAVSSDAHYERAYTLAQMLYSVDDFEAPLDFFLKPDTVGVYMEDKKIAAREKKYPGLFIARQSAMVEAGKRFLSSNLPALWNQKATLLAASLNDTEIAEILDYYSSPAWQHYRSALQRYWEGKRLDAIKQEIRDGKKQAGGADDALPTRSVNELERLLVFAELDESDQITYLRLVQSPVGKKFNTLGPQMAVIDKGWSSAMHSDYLAQIGAAADKAASAYITKLDGRTGQ